MKEPTLYRMEKVSTIKYNTSNVSQKANKAPKLILRNLNFGKDTAGTKVFHFA